MDNQCRLSQEQLQYVQQVVVCDLVCGLVYEIKNLFGGLCGVVQLFSKVLFDLLLFEYIKVIIEQVDWL